MGILVDSCAGVLDASSLLKLGRRVTGTFDELLAEIFVVEPNALGYGLGFEPDGVSRTGEKVHAFFEPSVLRGLRGFGMRG